MKNYELTEKEANFVNVMLQVNRSGADAWKSLVADNFSCVETSDLKSIGNEKVIAGLISSLEEKEVIEIEERGKKPDLYWFTMSFVEFMAAKEQ
jgi:hypothetical protein